MEEDLTPELKTMCAVFDLIGVFCEYERDMSDELIVGLNCIVKSKEFAIGVGIMKAAEPKMMEALVAKLQSVYELMKEDE